MSPQEITAEIIGTLAPLPQGPLLREAVESLARKHFLSPASIYRKANEAGLRWRKQRADKGNGKIGREDALKIGSLLLATRRLTNSIPLPACDAVEILQDSGLLTKDISVSTCLRALREHSVSAKDITKPTPHISMRAEYPNQMHQFDVTNCIQYFLDEKKGLGERDAEMTLYKNKVVKEAKKIRRELLRYVVVDKCSGAFFFWYYYAARERTADGIDFLYRAWRPKADERYRFHGVPTMLYADRGSIAKAKSMQNMLDALKVTLEVHMPGNPRAKGAVEGMMHFINRFEARLGLKRPRDLEELNSWAQDWTIYINAEKEFRKSGMARSAGWQLIRPEQLRLCPDWETLSTCIRSAKITRTVNDNLIVFYQGKAYRLPDSQLAGQKVTVCYNIYALPEIEVATEGGTLFTVAPLEYDPWKQAVDAVPAGKFKALKHTDTQKAKNEMEEVAEGFGIKWKGTKDKRRGQAPPLDFESPLQVFSHQADKVGNVAFMDKKGTEIEVNKAMEPRKVSTVKGMQEIIERIKRRLTKEENAYITGRFCESMSEEDINQVTEELQGKEAHQETEHIAGNKHWRASQR